MTKISATKPAEIHSRGVMEVAERDFEVVTEVGSLGLEDWNEVKLA